MENTRKLKGHVPFGYKKEEKELIPIESELEALDEIKDLINNKVISLREGSSDRKSTRLN